MLELGGKGVVDLLIFTKCRHPSKKVLCDKEYVQKMKKVIDYIFKVLREYNWRISMIEVSERSFRLLKRLVEDVGEERDIADPSYYRLIVDLLSSENKGLVKCIKGCDDVGNPHHIEYCEIRKALRKAVRDCSLMFVISCVSERGVFTRDELCKILRSKYEDVHCYSNVSVDKNTYVVVLLISGDEIVGVEECLVC